MTGPVEPRGSVDATVSGLVASLSLPLPPEIVEAVAERAAEIVIERIGATGPEPWIGVEAAAEHLACKPRRIYELVAQRRVRVRRDGRRVLFRRSWLDEALEEQPEGWAVR